VSIPDSWLASHTAGAPDSLCERVLAWAALTDPGQPISERLSSAGQAALEAVLHSGQDRSVALDLLAADALVTLAFLAQAECDPGGLQGLARQVRVGAAAS
jgi:hypothetical protein